MVRISVQFTVHKFYLHYGRVIKFMKLSIMWSDPHPLLYSMAVVTSYYPSPDAIAYSGAFFGTGSGPIVLDDVACTGSETALINCTYDATTSDCSHFEDAGVQCRSKETLLSVINCKPARRLKH